MPVLTQRVGSPKERQEIKEKLLAIIVAGMAFAVIIGYSVLWTLGSDGVTNGVAKTSFKYERMTTRNNRHDMPFTPRVLFDVQDCLDRTADKLDDLCVNP